MMSCWQRQQKSRRWSTPGHYLRTYVYADDVEEPFTPSHLLIRRRLLSFPGSLLAVGVQAALLIMTQPTVIIIKIILTALYNLWVGITTPSKRHKVLSVWLCRQNRQIISLEVIKGHCLHPDLLIPNDKSNDLSWWIDLQNEAQTWMWGTADKSATKGYRIIVSDFIGGYLRQSSEGLKLQHQLVLTFHMRHVWCSQRRFMKQIETAFRIQVQPINALWFFDQSLCLLMPWT